MVCRNVLTRTGALIWLMQILLNLTSCRCKQILSNFNGLQRKVTNEPRCTFTHRLVRGSSILGNIQILNSWFLTEGSHYEAISHKLPMEFEIYVHHLKFINFFPNENILYGDYMYMGGGGLKQEKCRSLKMAITLFCYTPVCNTSVKKSQNLSQ